MDIRLDFKLHLDIGLIFSMLKHDPRADAAYAAGETETTLKERGKKVAYRGLSEYLNLFLRTNKESPEKPYHIPVLSNTWYEGEGA